jgi:hypothetical protein
MRTLSSGLIGVSSPSGTLATDAAVGGCGKEMVRVAPASRARRGWRKRSGRSSAGLVAVGVGLLLAAPACGSAAADGGEGVASIVGGGSEQAAAAADDPEAPSDPDEAFALFEECLSDQGFDFESVAGDDAEIGGGEAPDGRALVIERAGPRDGSDPQAGSGGRLVVDDPDAFQEAEEVCRPHLANVQRDIDLSPEQEAAMEDAQLRFADCMEEHGIEGLDVAAGGGPGIDIRSERVDEGPAAPDPDDLDFEALQEATEACMGIFDEYPELEDVVGGGGFARGED